MTTDTSSTLLRALAHPLRVRLLMKLREGPATSAILARHTGQTRGNVSYHLRALAEAGAIAEDPEHGTERERWWRVTVPPEIDALALIGGEGVEDAAEALTTERGRRLARFGARLSADEVPSARVAATRLSELRLSLSASQQATLVAELDAVLASWEHVENQATDDGERVEIQLAVFSVASDE